MSRFNFVFTVSAGRGATVETIKGVLPTESAEDVRDFMSQFRGLLLDFRPLQSRPLSRKPPKGMVAIKKKVTREESE